MEIGVNPFPSIAADEFSSNYRSFTKPGPYSFTVPNGVSRIWVSVIAGAGGSGGGGAASADAPGGNGGVGGRGARIIKFPLRVYAGMVFDVVVGDAGSAGAANTSGTTGGNSLFGKIVAGAGTGGTNGTNAVNLDAGSNGAAGVNGVISVSDFEHLKMVLSEMLVITPTVVGFGEAGNYGAGGTSANQAGAAAGASQTGAVFVEW